MIAVKTTSTLRGNMKIKPILFAMILCGVVTAHEVRAESYTFKLNNTTKNTMKKLLVSEDGKKWSEFDIGKGIPAGQSATMVWDESTDDQGCEQKVKAIYDDGSESPPTEFDFCEKDLELDF